ncbi:ABC transporter ATP-binding protein [Anaerococcus vaginalis]|nr:ABC transporter ATP-binding protein [Anaerococcus vaginalis]QQB62490.1 ABC transporter ATP-binding protein [Anaerococcus vaginalis]CAG7585202.1 Vitamin B12 import ATP-binding protein BtuD [Peptoniphilus tyrrelliae]
MRNIKRCIEIAYNSNRNHMIIYILLTILNGIFSGISIFSLQNLVNVIQVSYQNDNSMIIPVGKFLIINIAFILISSLQQYSYSILSFSMDKYLCVVFAENCNELSVKDFENEEVYNKIGQINRFGKDKVVEIFFNIVQFIESVIAIITISGIIFSSSNNSWVIIILIPIINFLINIRFGKYIYNIENDNIVLYRKQEYCNYLISNNIACKERIFYNFGESLIKKLDQVTDAIILKNKKITVLTLLINSIFNIIELIAKVYLILVESISVFTNDGLLGSILAYIYSLDIVMQKTNLLLGNMLLIISNRLYVETFFGLIDKNNTNNKKTDDLRKINKINQIELKNISYSYDGNKNVLSNINIKFDHNGLYIIKGGNGRGKSTLLKLLCGLYFDYTGEIRVNGLNISSYSLLEYRARIGVVFQDFNRYETSVKANIALNKMNETDCVLKIKKLLNSKGIKIKDINPNTILGNWFGGKELSGGEWQKIAFLRSLYNENDILIADEPTSNLDFQSKQKLVEFFIEESKKKIIILATHDDIFDTIEHIPIVI